MAAVSPGRQSEIICFFFFYTNEILSLTFRSISHPDMKGKKKMSIFQLRAYLAKDIKGWNLSRFQAGRSVWLKFELELKSLKTFIFKLRVTECPQRSKLVFEIENIEVFVKRKSCLGAVWLDWIRSDNKQDEPQPHSCHRFFFNSNVPELWLVHESEKSTRTEISCVK